MKKIGPLERCTARAAAAEAMVFDLVAEHFRTEGAFDAWAQAHANEADALVDARTLTPGDPRFAGATAYRDALANILSEARLEWRRRRRPAAD